MIELSSRKTRRSKGLFFDQARPRIGWERVSQPSITPHHLKQASGKSGISRITFSRDPKGRPLRSVIRRICSTSSRTCKQIPYHPGPDSAPGGKEPGFHSNPGGKELDSSLQQTPEGKLKRKRLPHPPNHRDRSLVERQVDPLLPDLMGPPRTVRFLERSQTKDNNLLPTHTISQPSSGAQEPGPGPPL